MAAIAYPYLRVDPTHLTATPWTLVVDGIERDLPDRVEAWEHSVDLQLMRRLRLDFAAVASDLEIDPDRLGLEVIVTAGTGGANGDRRRQIWWRGALDAATTECAPMFQLPGGDLSQAVSLRTELVLQRPVGEGSDLSPKLRGTRLWDDRQLLGLEPEEPRFPTMAASFRETFPDTPAAFWRLAWSPEDPSRDFSSAVSLFLNSDRPGFIQAFSGNDDLVTRQVMGAIIAQITRGVLANEAFSDTLAAEAPTSIGAAVLGWLDRALPGSTPAAAIELMQRDPARFEAALAALTAEMTDA